MANNPLSKSEKDELEELLEKNINSDSIISRINEIINNKVKEEFSKTEKKYQHLFKNSPLTVVLFNAEGVLLDINESANDLMSIHTVEDLIGLHYRDIWSFNEKNKRLIPIYDRFFEKLLNTGEPSELEFPIHQSEGGAVWVQAYTSIYEIKGKRYIQFLLDDITERKKSQQKLKESREIFKAIAQQSFISITIIQDDKFIYFNEEFLRITGYTKEEVENWAPGEYLKIIHPDDREFVKQQAIKKQKGKDDYIENYEFRGIRKNGKVYWCEIFSKTVIYEGRTADLILTLDITERKLREKALKESEEKFRTIAEQTSIGIAIFQDQRIEYLNHAYADLVGYPYEEVKDWSYLDLAEIIHEEDIVIIGKIFNQFHIHPEKQNNVNYITRIRKKNGQIKWLESTLTRITYKNRDAMLITIVDLTEKKKAEKELKRLNKLKSELLRRTSHELKTPLVSIKGFSNLLTELYSHKMDEEMKAIVDEIKKGSDRLENLIRDILKASKLQSGKIKLEKRYGNLVNIIKTVLNEMKGAIQERRHTIHIDIHEELKTLFEPKRIKEVIENLLINAIKYTPPEGDITITSERTSDLIKLFVIDTGIGLTEEEQDSIFREFGKIEKFGQGWDIGTEGTGLGLYISKKIVELHEGEIGVESEGKDKGSTFYFTLPVID
ncbi:MAG: PAS domain S-box protein [Candidatus Lokiarchaeota archaeon]|nr:PAS domain S-box protein [Candidatus Lokiarchaeota archaeon]